MDAKKYSRELIQRLPEFEGGFAHAIRATIEAGYAIKTLAGKGTETAKESHRSVAGEGDARSQKILLAGYAEAFPQANFLCEEATRHPRALPLENPAGILEGTALVVDPVDCTVSFAANTGDWSVGAGLMEQGIPVGSILFTPAKNGGLVIASHKKSGLVSLEWSGSTKTRHQKTAKEKPLKESTVYFGVDTMRYPALATMWTSLTSRARAVMTIPSALLGLGLAAMGRAEGVIQTPQRIWDIVPLLHALKATGKKIVFYRIHPATGKIRWVKELDFDAFCYAPEKRVGLIAGQPGTVKKLCAMLEAAGPLVKTNTKLRD
ncbi:MAG: hypothetical protein HYY10_01255 [Candidatus Liptonbacteria bacterium]|nr:hypothetical protein [Candidatus Liptonbacteria bacterium]